MHCNNISFECKQFIISFVLTNVTERQKRNNLCVNRIQTSTHYTCTNPIRRFYLCLCNVSILTPFPFANPAIILSSVCLSAALLFSVAFCCKITASVFMTLARGDEEKNKTQTLSSLFIWDPLSDDVYSFSHFEHTRSHIKFQCKLVSQYYDFSFFSSLSLSLSLFLWRPLFARHTNVNK